MKELNVVLTELGISKVRLAKYLGVSRQMLYNYLAIDNINNWPKEKAAKLLSLLNIIFRTLSILFLSVVCSSKVYYFDQYWFSFVTKSK